MVGLTYVIISGAFLQKVNRGFFKDFLKALNLFTISVAYECFDKTYDILMFLWQESYFDKITTFPVWL